MLRSIGADAVHLVQQILRDAMRLAVAAATVDNPVAHCRDRGETDLLVEPVEQEIGRRPVIKVTDASIILTLPSGISESETGSSQADAVDLAMQSAHWRIT